MATANLSEYKTLYLQTAKEYINNISSSCIKLGGNVSDIEAVNNIHISSHSLKSQSQVMGFINMANLCAIIEKISAAILAGNYKISNELIAVLKESVNEINLCLVQIEKENKENDLSEFVRKLETMSGVV